MTHRDLTIAQVLKDPLIRQVMRADHISVAGMANLLKDTARRQQPGVASIANVPARKVRQADLR